MWHFISEKISETLNFDFICDDIRETGGGDTHSSYRITDGKRRFFVKINEADAYSNFHAEADGLDHLRHPNIIRIPKHICHGIVQDKSFLVLEHMTLKKGSNTSWYDLGSKLAELHKSEIGPNHGWQVNNFIGKTEQHNHWESDWYLFFAEQRIGHMLNLLANEGVYFVDIDKAVDTIKSLLKSHTPTPSILHGDLWAGNVGFQNGSPVIFDPAFYFGDRETDLAMTELFSRFPDSFYQGYNASWKVDDGYKERKQLYQLYHILNHALLFGGQYVQSAKTSLQHLES